MDAAKNLSSHSPRSSFVYTGSSSSRVYTCIYFPYLCCDAREVVISWFLPCAVNWNLEHVARCHFGEMKVETIRLLVLLFQASLQKVWLEPENQLRKPDKERFQKRRIRRETSSWSDKADQFRADITSVSGFDRAKLEASRWLILSVAIC